MYPPPLMCVYVPVCPHVCVCVCLLMCVFLRLIRKSNEATRSTELCSNIGELQDVVVCVWCMDVTNQHNKTSKTAHQANETKKEKVKVNR